MSPLKGGDTMYSVVKIKCQCNKLFDVNFEDTKHDEPIRCPFCHLEMDLDSHHTLRNLMGSFKDFNQHIIKYHLERNEPKMIAKSIFWQESSTQDQD
jgi:hypothetical protein